MSMVHVIGAHLSFMLSQERNNEQAVGAWNSGPGQVDRASRLPMLLGVILGKTGGGASGDV